MDLRYLFDVVALKELNPKSKYLKTIIFNIFSVPKNLIQWSHKMEQFYLNMDKLNFEMLPWTWYMIFREKK